ncbi:hypothetical protein LCGC14_2851720, partial [marine sediment metagenome]
AATLISGASVGGSGTAGDTTVDTGAAAGGAEGSINIGSAVTKKIGFYGVTPVVQPAGAVQGTLDAYGTGAFGLDSDARMQALFDLVVNMRLAMVSNGLIKGGA